MTAGSGRPGAPGSPAARLLTYAPWPGDLNNTRMCFENAVVLAMVLGRSLVVPGGAYRRIKDPPGRVYAPPHPEDLVDLDRLRQALPVEVAEGVAPHAVEPDQVGEIRLSTDDVFCLPDIPARGTDAWAELQRFAAGRGSFVALPEGHHEVPVLHVTGLLFPFYTLYFFLDPRLRDTIKRAIRDHVTYRPEIVALAGTLRSQLGRFFAVHIRRGDFVRAYPRVVLPAERICAELRPHVPAGALLYVATDETDRSFFHPLEEVYELRFFSDLHLRDGLPIEMIGAAEQLLCAGAERFVGTRLSTFSAYINRLRGHGAAADTGFYFTDGIADPEAEPGHPTWWATGRAGTPIWGREYPEAWRFEDVPPAGR